ncbi:MAG TPA: ABC transporter permease [Edaphobacter sp.]|jgi:putative ABC transport system permease protein|nr:ABC transporter permease [Edaphobacter sp.]
MSLIRKIRNLFHRADIDREINAELQSHIDLATEANMGRGLPRAAARREALLRFGNPTTTREHVTAADATLSLDRFWADLRYAGRQLVKSPGFSITAILSISIGIGANTAIFSSMDAVVLRPLAVPAMDHVLTIAEHHERTGDDNVSLANYEDWVRRSRSFEELSVRTGVDMNLTSVGDAAHIHAEMASANFFSVLRVQPLLGRLFVDNECTAGRDTVAVLNYGFWQRNFAGDPSILGRRIELDQRTYTIIGVLPKSVQYPAEADIFLPFAPTPQQLANRSDHLYLVEGRLRDGVTLPQAQSELRSIASQLANTYPITNRGWTIHADPLLDVINGPLTPLYYRLLMGATFFVLLVVCANVANLQFARGIGRRTEIAMRTALGATRTRILRQLLTENILLGLIGAGGGLLFGWLYLRLTLVFMPEQVARHMSGWSNISLNGRAFALSLVLALVAGLVSGLAPALEALRINLSDQLKAGSRSTIGAGRRRWLRNIFAIAQISLAVALVVGAALMAKGMVAQLHVADAYNPEKVLTFNVALPARQYDTPQKQAAWYVESLAKLRALPGVTHANVTNALPYSDYGWNREFQIENRPTTPGKDQNALNLVVDSDYFSAFHIPIIDGRAFSGSDSIQATPVAIVSPRFVAQYFPGQNPIGHRIRMGHTDSSDPWLTIVGVAHETSYTLWDQNQYSVVYVNTTQRPSPTTTYTITTNGNPLALAEPARKALASIDPALPLDSILTWHHFLIDELIGLIYAAGMIGLDALIALFLAAIGIFGVMANVVGEQTREIGVRLAMGARREDVLRMVLRRASRLTGIGLLGGLALAFFLARGVANLLVGVRPDDPLVFGSITVTIALIALASSWIPARRASRVDPLEALRSE